MQNRIARLVEGGVLLGFTVRLREDAAGAAVRAIMSIEVRSADMRAVITALRRMPEVGQVYSTNGRWDLVAEINTTDLAALDRALTAIRTLKAVANSETSILLAALKVRPARQAAAPLPVAGGTPTGAERFQAARRRPPRPAIAWERGTERK